MRHQRWVDVNGARAYVHEARLEEERVLCIGRFNWINLVVLNQ